MKRVLVDLNIILDFLNRRNKHQVAARIINLCVEEHLEGLLAAHEITTLSYFLLKESKDPDKTRRILEDLLDIFTIIPTDRDILRAALASGISDFEDAVFETSGLRAGVDCIISNNLHDFRRSRVRTLSPEQFLVQFSSG